MKYVLSLSIVAFMGLASTVSAEPDPFEGQVVTQKSVPIYRAQVVIYRLDNPLVRMTALTDESGVFSLSLRDFARRCPTDWAKIIPIRSIPPRSYPSR